MEIDEEMRKKLFGYICKIPGKIPYIEDLVQEALIRAWKENKDPFEKDSEGNTIVKEVINEFNKEERDRQKAEQVFTILQDLNRINHDPRARAARAVINAMDKKYGKALKYFYIERMSGEKAARRLGVSRDHFYVLLQRAREKLKDVLEEWL